MAHYESWWKPRDGTAVDSDSDSDPDGGSSASATHPSTSFTFHPMSPPAEPEGEMLPTRRLHILGLGSIGLFVAYALKQMHNAPPITLMMHRRDAYDTFKKLGRQVRLLDKASGIVDEQEGYDVDFKAIPPKGLDTSSSEGVYWKYVPALDPPGTPDPAKPPPRPVHPLEPGEVLASGEVYIHCLILTVKAQHTVSALLGVKHRLDARSTICLLQNGLGQIDEINRHVFPDPATRPTYLVGVLSHGCYSKGPFVVVHAGMGTTSLGIYRDTDKYPLPAPELAERPPSALSPQDQASYFPTDEQLYNSSVSARFLLRSLTRSTLLCSAAYPYLDLRMLQLEKLSTNALINPLTALYDVPNGAMLGNSGLNIVQNMLVSETSLVLRSLPELQGIPNLRHRFSAHRLKALFAQLASKTALNSSSMREDLRFRLPTTEIDYINGYVVRRGQELGIPCPAHFMLTHLLKARLELDRQRDADFVPFDTGKKVVGEIDLAKLATAAATTTTSATTTTTTSAATATATARGQGADDAPVVVEDKGVEKRDQKAVSE